MDYLGALDRDAASNGVDDRGKALSIIAEAPTMVVTYYRLNRDGSYRGHAVTWTRPITLRVLR